MDLRNFQSFQLTDKDIHVAALIWNQCAAIRWSSYFRISGRGTAKRVEHSIL